MKARMVSLTVLIVLITGCSGSVEPVEVTGGLPEPAREIPGEESGDPIGGGRLSQVRGTIYLGPWDDLSDSRVVGEAEHVMDIDFVVEGDRTTGFVTVTSLTISNDGGTWEGTGEGTTTWTATDPDHLHSLDYTLTGTGDYADLVFTFHAEGVDFPWAITGTIEPVDQ